MTVRFYTIQSYITRDSGILPFEKSSSGVYKAKPTWLWCRLVSSDALFVDVWPTTSFVCQESKLCDFDLPFKSVDQ